ncbi:MAG: phosphoribosylformylglycinamidine cyclo-ligase [Anaerolineae bacterium]|jgi:phosphoribosylaminoimidazole synthetase
MDDRRESAYRRAGVDIDTKMRALELMAESVRSTYGPEVLAGMGQFGGLYSAAALTEMRHPVLVASTDSVGTKVMLAARAGRYEGLGEDIVNHSLNDILVQGAEPLFFLDYLAAPKLDPEVLAALVSGMAKACREAGCALIAGETAELPGIYQEGQFDVVGAIVGLVEKDGIIDGRDIAPGDQLIGLPSSGPHTNGYTLIRAVFADYDLGHVFPELGVPLADALLAPHRSYLPEVRRLRQAVHVKGLAHITGGGFLDNIPRILPPDVCARVQRRSWQVPPLFGLIQRLGAVDEAEMYRVFNMGMGMVVVVPAEELGRAMALAGPGAAHLGEISEREKDQVELI